MKKILPQANDLDHVIDVVAYINSCPRCSLDDIAEYMGFTYRQARYYFDAARYLDLVDEQRNPTSLTKDIYKRFPESVTECVYERIITDELMGQVFAKAFLFPSCDVEKYSQELVSIYYPEIVGNTTFKRRSHVIVLWCERIIKYVTSKHI